MALPGETVHVQLGDEQGGVPEGRILGQEGAVFRDQMLLGEDHVLGGFIGAGVAVDVAAEQPGGGGGDEHPAILGFADDLVGGGGVGDDGRAAAGQELAGRAGGPQVLAQLDADAEVLHRLVLQQHVGAEGDCLAPEEDFAVLDVPAGGKLPHLIELAVVGQVGLGDEGQHLAVVDGGGAVVELAPVPQGQAEDDQGILVPGEIADRLQGPQGGLLEDVGVEEVAAGVAGDRQLRQHQQIDAGGVGLEDAGLDFFRVGQGVRHGGADGTRGNFDKAVLHRNGSFPYLSGSIIPGSGRKCNPAAKKSGATDGCLRFSAGACRIEAR